MSLPVLGLAKQTRSRQAEATGSLLPRSKRMEEPLPLPFPPRGQEGVRAASAERATPSV